MEAKAKFLGHSVHQMLVVFPLGLLSTAVVFDAIGMTDGGHSWFTAAYYLISAGLIGGVVAAVFGFIDWLGIPSGTRAKRVGLYHAIVNATVMLMFAVSLSVRGSAAATPGTSAFVLSFLGAVLALVGGWLGGELVGRLGVGVDDRAHLNATSSLRPVKARDR